MNKKATNSSLMKSGNRLLVLNIVRKKRVSRAELARLTGLTRAGITLIVDELIGDGVLAETGTEETAYGRKPILLDILAGSRYAASVSITRDGCKIGVVDIKGNVLAGETVRLPRDAGIEATLDVIIQALRQVLAAACVDPIRLIGLGLSVPGPIRFSTGTILNPPNFDLWHNVNIVEAFEKAFPYKVFLENNSTALAISEKNYGIGLGLNSFLLMVVNIGIGAGIIMNDKVYRGRGGFGSEVGHASINCNGETCSCGNTGCLELYASMPAALRRLPPALGLTGWEGVVDAALAGNGTALSEVEQEAFYLAAGIVNAMNILELEAVVLTGDIRYKSELLVAAIRRRVHAAAMHRKLHKVKIVASAIEEDPDILSAAAIVFEKYFAGEA